MTNVPQDMKLARDDRSVGIWLDGLKCQEEATIRECCHSEMGVNGCNHDMDVYLVCDHCEYIFLCFFFLFCFFVCLSVCLLVCLYFCKFHILKCNYIYIMHFLLQIHSLCLFACCCFFYSFVSSIFTIQLHNYYYYYFLQINIS